MYSNKQRPIILVIERLNDNDPSGYPTVTKMRTMGALEHLWYMITKKLVKTNRPEAKITSPEINVGVTLSREQYDMLVGRDPESSKALEYLVGTKMELVMPPDAYPTVSDRELVAV